MGDKSLTYLDFELLEEPSMLETGSIALYGAAEKGLWVSTMLQVAGINIVAFADHDPNKWGTNLNGIPILSPQEMRNTLLTEAGRKYVISCIENTDECYQLLSELFSKDDVSSIGFISFWGIDFCIHTHREEFAARSKDVAALFEKEKADDHIQYTQEFLQRLSNLSHKSKEILVFQPGKVGSTTITKMIQNANVPCINLHQLSCPAWFWGTALHSVWENAVGRLQAGNNKIISIVRGPLSRDYSAFWHYFSAGDRKYRYMFQEVAGLQEKYELLMDRILHGLKGLERYGFEFPFFWRDEFEWFDEEMKAYLGLDVYQYPFDREKGYTIIREGNIELFLLKLEKLGSVLPALEAFIGGGVRLNLEKDNAASAKTYSMVYRAFRQGVRLKQEYVDYYFTSNAKVDHFYTKEEQAEFLMKWKDNIGSI